MQSKKIIPLSLIALIIFAAIGYIIIRDQRSDNGTTKPSQQSGTPESSPQDDSQKEDLQSNEDPDEPINPLEVTYGSFSDTTSTVTCDYPDTWSPTQTSNEYDILSDSEKSGYDIERLFMATRTDTKLVPHIILYKLSVPATKSPKQVMDDLLDMMEDANLQTEIIFENEQSHSIGYEAKLTTTSETLYSKEKLIFSSSTNNSQREAYLLIFRASNSTWEVYADLARFITISLYVEDVQRENTERELASPITQE